MESSNSNLTFCLDKSSKKMILVGVLLFSGGLVCSVAIPFFIPFIDKRFYMEIWWIMPPVIVGYFLFAKLFLKAWKQRNNHVVVNEDSISLHSPEKRIEMIKWNEISEIKEDNCLQRLIIKDKHRKIVTLEYQLVKMSDLINVIADKTPHLTEKYANSKKFRRLKAEQLFFGMTLVFFSFMTFSSWYFEEGTHITIGLFAFFCFFLFVFIKESTGVRILDDGISITYPLWKKEIKFTQIKKISMEHFVEGNCKSGLFVILKLSDDKEFKSCCLQEGTMAFFAALKSSSSAFRR